MFNHDLRVILRNFLRFKNYFFINLLGLSTGLASLILIYLWVNDELAFDKFHEKNGRLFQVMESRQQDGAINTSGNTADFLAAALTAELPEIEYATVVTPPKFFPLFTLSATGSQVKSKGKFVGEDFFNIFTYPLVLGDTKHILDDKNNVVLSETLAKKLFVTPGNSIGKPIEWRLLGLKKDMVVSGVYKDLPEHSSEQFDFIISFNSFRELMGMNGGELNWDNDGPFFTYLTLKNGVNLDRVNDKIKNFISQKSAKAKHRALFLKPYADNYLFGHYENGKESGGRIEYVILFSTIAVFILLIACVNFVNLSTAQALRRIKETGIKRIIGAQRITLILRYLKEAFVITLLSAFLACLIVALLLPQFNTLAGKHIEFILNARTISALIALIVLTAIAAGSYPAVYLSSFNPAQVLKNQGSSSFAERLARKGLVIFQFTLSVIFIVFATVVYKQIDFIQTRNLGYNKENVVYFEVEGKISENPDNTIAEIERIPGVSAASSMLGGIVMQSDASGTPGMIEWNGRKVTINNSAVNYGLIELLGIEMKEGRTFSRDISSDANKIIFNEAAIEALGIENPVGKIIDGREVLGIVKNFHYQSFHESVKPYCFRMEPASTSAIVVKIQPGKEEKTIPEIEKIYKANQPDGIFNYSFLDNDFQQQYVAEKRVSVLSRYGTGLTVFISCLGLFGLAMFTVEKKGKEIGIRKVLGSSEFAVVILLSGEFIKLVIVAILVALPISYLLVINWLDSFAYRIDLGWWYFIYAAVITIFISMLTVSMQTFRVAKTNPAKVLRAE